MSKINYTRKDHKKLKKDSKKWEKSFEKDVKFTTKKRPPKKVVKCYNCGRISKPKELINATFKGRRVKRCPACLRIIPKK